MGHMNVRVYSFREWADSNAPPHPRALGEKIMGRGWGAPAYRALTAVSMSSKAPRRTAHCSGESAIPLFPGFIAPVALSS